MKNINKMLNDMKKELTQLQDERSEFDKYMEEHRKRSARSQELNKPEYYNTIRAKWRIDYIDYGCKFTEVVKDHITGDNFSDLSSNSYESSQFIGTKKQLHDMLKPFELLPHNEVKIIGSSFMEEVDVDHDQVYQDYINSKK
jgi:hypothetical protein|tara:strand:- start:79 stop:504 length:426 start_codon:yes stop_codon:yes gene_type:complete